MQEPAPRPVKTRRRLAGLAALLILALTLVVVYRQRHNREDDSGEATSGTVLGSQALKVAPGIYYLGGLTPAAAYVVETSDGLVLIDTGLDKEAGPLRQQMASLGLDWKRLRAILLTHVH